MGSRLGAAAMTSAHGRIAWLIVVASITATAGSALADQRSVADRHLERGLAYYAQERYERAIAQFQRGYAVEPRREFLFALAQAERLSGDCASAVTYYRQFLSRNPPVRQVTATWEHLRACGEASRPEAPVEAAPASRVSIETPAAPPATTPPWYRDVVGTSLLGAGVVCLGTSMAMFVAASSARDSARLAPTYEAFDELADRARTRRNLGITFGVAAGALGGAALYRLVWGRPQVRGHVELAPTTGGASVSLGGRF
jgi:tetratricopeptide (TPR) repeat protein